MDPIILPRISDQKPLVSVITATYNHERYIRDCLEGFLMQKTNFPVEVIIHDDASTDHTADIIREYYEKRPDLFHVIIERENQYSQHKIISIPLYKQAQGKYMAFCEGDDYWTDPLKLQKQFDFMESNPEYPMCGTKFQAFNQKKERTVKIRNKKKGTITLDQIIRGNPYATCTTFLKKEIVLEWVDLTSTIDRTRWMMGDFPLFIYLTTKGKGYILPCVTSRYRILEQSASHGNYQKSISFSDNSFHIRLRMINVLQLPFSSKEIIIMWAYERVKNIIKWKEYDSSKSLYSYWRIFWKNQDYSYKPVKFLILFSIAFILILAGVCKSQQQKNN